MGRERLLTVLRRLRGQLLVAGSLALVLAGVYGCDNGAGPGPVPDAKGFRLRYDEHGTLVAGSDQTRQRVLAAATDATDVFIFSHGWWNTPESAECRYGQMIAGLASSRPASLTGAGFRPLVVGIYWPSAIFPLGSGDCEGPESLREAGATEPAAAALRDRLSVWARAGFPEAAGRPEFAGELERAAALLDREASGERLAPADGQALVGILLRWRDVEQGSGPRPSPDGPGEAAFEGSALDVAQRWLPGSRGGAARTGESAGPDEAGGTAWLDWANAFTFWTMKDRAGIVGSHGVYDLVRALQDRRRQGMRIHLVGHSFGGKLLAAAITGHGRGPANTVDSFVIIQGAFSHFALSTAEQIRRFEVEADQAGLYVDIVAGRRVEGPLVATFSEQDVPNQVLYRQAVRVSGGRFEAAKIDRYGSLGADGIQGPTVQVLVLARERLADRLGPGPPPLVNVDGTDVIQGHGDFVKPEVFGLIWDAVVAARARPPR